MARIAFIGTGGTLANAGTGVTDYLSYLSGGKILPAREILNLGPDLSEFAEVIPHTYAARRSKEMGPRQWLELRAAVAEILADPTIDGVIIGHGTGVLEETAFFLHLALDTVKPVVAVGAQRPPTTLGSDAHKNLLDAVHWIRTHGDRDQPVGVVVIMDQTVHSARGVAKVANHTLGAMASPVAGPIARVNVDGTIAFYRTPSGRHTVRSEFLPLFPSGAQLPSGAQRTGCLAGEVPADGDARATGDGAVTAAVAGGEQLPDGAITLPRVDVVVQYAGADATAMDAHVATGARGIVLVGFPPGTNTPDLDAAIERHAATGVVIVQASRAIRDPQILARAGLGRVVRNSDLSPQQARILLMFALARGYGHSEIQRVFDEY